MNPSAAADRLACLLSLRDVRSVAGGLEFEVFRATAPTGVEWALRVPRKRLYRTPGEVPIPAARLQNQERTIYRLLGDAGLPVPRPVCLIEDAESELPILVSHFVQSDGTPPKPADVGRFLAMTHSAPASHLDLVTHENTRPALALAARLRRRWTLIREHVADLPDLPAPVALAQLLAVLSSGPVSLVHLDVRACNLLSVAGRLHAVVDWSSAMIAHPVLEFARMREYEQLAENQIDVAGITAEYRRHLPVPVVGPATEAVLRLDAVTMLALVFLRYSPDPNRAAWAVDRLRELTNSK
jgi:aminoglycoside phosphotransferase (APT) family kinase protein